MAYFIKILNVMMMKQYLQQKKKSKKLLIWLKTKIQQQIFITNLD